MTTDTCDQQTKSLVSSCYAPLPRANGYVLYRGPSKIDGKPIVMIATGFKTGSGNVKTGAMIQTWILREDVEPHTAQKTGDDESICGNCPHRVVLRSNVSSAPGNLSCLPSWHLPHGETFSNRYPFR